MSGALTRILNNQIYSKTIIASQKIADGTITGSLFSSNVTVPGDFLITGNLFVLGSSSYTTIASTNTYVNDPLVVLNNGFSGTNTYDEGLIFNRGTSTNQALIWSEYFGEFRLISTAETGTTYGNVNSTGLVRLSVGSLNVPGTANIGTLAVTNVITASSINVSGNVLASTMIASYYSGSTATFGNIAAVTFGNTGSQFNGSAINLSGNVLAAAGVFNALTVNGNESVTGYLNVTGNVLASDITGRTLSTRAPYGNIHLTQFASIYAQGNSSENQTLVQVSTTGLTDGAGLWAFTGAYSTLYSSQGISFRTGATMRDQDTPTGGVARVTITAAGDLWANATTASTNTTSGALVVGGGVGIAGNLNVGSTINTAGNVVAVAGTFNGLTVNGNETISGYINAAGNISTPQLNAGQINTTGNVLAQNGVFNGLAVNGPVSGYLNVTGNIMADVGTLSALNVNGVINASGNILGSAGTLSTLVLNSTTNSTQAVSTGALQVAGGGSFGKDLFVLGNIYAANIIGTGYQYLSVQDPLLYLQANVPYPYSYDIGIYSHFVGGSGNTYQHTGMIRDNNDGYWKIFSNVAEPAGGQVNFTNAIYDGVLAGNLTLAHTTDSTSSSTGALIVGGGAGFGGNLFFTGPYLDTSSSNFVFAKTSTTANLLSAGTSIQVGAASGVFQVRNPSVDSVQSTLALFNANVTTLNFAGAATTIAVGANSGTITVGNPTLVGTQAVQNVYNSTATSINAFGAATMLQLGATTGMANIRNAYISFPNATDIITTQTSLNLFNANVTTLNLAGAGTLITIGSTTGNTVIRTADTFIQGVANVNATRDATSTTSAALTVAGGAAVKAGMIVGGTFYANSATDNTTSTGTGAIVVPNGGISASGNIWAGHNLYVGPNKPEIANTSAYAGAIIVAGKGNQYYTQMVLGNDDNRGSADYAAYASDGNDTSGWVDLGFTGNAFSDSNYSITKPHDGYLLTKGNGAKGGGNLVLATGQTGTYNDIVIGVGSFESSAEVARFHGNVSNNGNLRLSYATVSTTPQTGALTVVGGVGAGGNLRVGGGAVFNSTQGHDPFVVMGAATTGLIYADVNNSAVTVGGGGYQGPGSASTTLGASFKVQSTDSMIVPVGTSAQRPSGGGGNVDVAGMVRFNTTITNLEFYDGTQWQAAGSAFTVISDRQFSGTTPYGNVDGVNKTFTIQASSTTSATIVSINGVIQFPVLAYDVSGTSLTFTEAPAVDDVIDVRVLATTTVVGTFASGNGLNQVITDNTGVSIWSGSSSTIERILVDTSGNMNFLTGNDVTYTQTPVNIPSASTPVLIDSFSTSSYTTAKYIVQIRNGSSAAEAAEILLSQDTANVYLTTYGVVGTNMGTFACNIASGNVRLYFTSTSLTNSNVKVMSTYIV